MIKNLRTYKLSETIDKSHKNKTDQAIEELSRYKNLLELGAITQKEFDEKKAELMPILRQNLDKDETESAPASAAPSVEKPTQEDKPITAKIEKPAEEKKETNMQKYGILIFIAVIILFIGGVVLTSTLIDRHKTKVQLAQSLKPAPMTINTPFSKPNINMSAFDEEKVVSKPKEVREENLSTDEEIVYLTENDKKVIDQFFALYDELMGFKSKTDFISIGFTPNGKYYKWLQRAQKLNTDANAQILMKLRVVPYDLEGLGFEYVISKGKESEATKLFQTSIKEARSQYKELKQK